VFATSTTTTAFVFAAFLAFSSNKKNQLLKNIHFIIVSDKDEHTLI
jgi:hypothetical protein